MKVRNMKSNTGRAVPNQFVIVDDIFEVSTKQNVTVEYFQSYDSVIVKKCTILMVLRFVLTGNTGTTARQQENTASNSWGSPRKKHSRKLTTAHTYSRT